MALRDVSASSSSSSPSSPTSSSSLKGAPPKLFDAIEPVDVCQGALGDCWLLAAVAAVAEFPNFIKSEVFITQEFNPDGL